MNAAIAPTLSTRSPSAMAHHRKCSLPCRRYRCHSNKARPSVSRACSSGAPAARALALGTVSCEAGCGAARSLVHEGDVRSDACTPPDVPRRRLSRRLRPTPRLAANVIVTETSCSLVASGTPDASGPTVTPGHQREYTRSTSRGYTLNPLRVNMTLRRPWNSIVPSSRCRPRSPVWSQPSMTRSPASPHCAHSRGRHVSRRRYRFPQMHRPRTRDWSPALADGHAAHPGTATPSVPRALASVHPIEQRDRRRFGEAVPLAQFDAGGRRPAFLQSRPRAAHRRRCRAGAPGHAARRHDARSRRAVRRRPPAHRRSPSRSCDSIRSTATSGLNRAIVVTRAPTNNGAIAETVSPNRWAKGNNAST